jgi:putative membrane protein
MMYRKSIVAAVAAISLGLGTTCTIARADDTAQNPPTANKNPADQPNKQEMNQTVADPDLQAKVQEQAKMKQDLMANYNDADFVKIASMANADEISAAKLALLKTHNDDVNKFAQKMIDDHTAAGAELKSLADSKSWMIYDQPDAAHEMAQGDMKKLEAADFDKAYASSAVADHQDAIALFKFAADKTTDEQLKAFVNKCLPTFQMHLKMAQDLESKLTAVGMTK